MGFQPVRYDSQPFHKWARAQDMADESPRGPTSAGALDAGVFTLDAHPSAVAIGTGGVIIAGDSYGRNHYFDVDG